MWHLGTWFSGGLGTVRFTIGLDDLKDSVSVFVNDLDDGTEFTLTRFVDDTKVAGQADVVEGRVSMQKDYNRLDNCTNKCCMRYYRETQALHNWNRITRSSSTGWDLAEWGVLSLNNNHFILLGQDTPEVHLWHQELLLNMVVFRTPVQERLQLTGISSGESHQDIGDGEYGAVALALWGEAEGPGLVQLGAGMPSGAPYSSPSAPVWRLLRRQRWAFDTDAL
ncbi:hypothetical protein QYF61_023471 [Mycteria americana]|uniref:Uncharacterized protein n=1 Tax=Mycteria americana TaxID=33587 RepID=A0AAN7S0Y1_MYCAM|nr:hypothetical protein QYF61_023471 [Mycteria americana]